MRLRLRMNWTLGLSLRLMGGDIEINSESGVDIYVDVEIEFEI